MFEQWMIQIQYLSMAQAGLLYVLSFALMGLAYIAHKREGGKDDV
jgi:hypothetical protein